MNSQWSLHPSSLYCRFLSSFSAFMAQEIPLVAIREVKWARLETGPVHLTNTACILPRVPLGERKPRSKTRHCSASGEMVLALGATVSGLLVLALGATGVTLLPAVFAFGATVTALGATLAPPETALGGTPVRGAIPTALGVILALGAPSLAVGPTPPTARPRWAKPTLVNKPSSIPQISTRFIHCPPLFFCSSCGQRSGATTGWRVSGQSDGNANGGCNSRARILCC